PLDDGSVRSAAQGGVEVDQVQQPGPERGPMPGRGHGVLEVHRLLGGIALVEPNGLASLDVDRRDDLEHQGESISSVLPWTDPARCAAMKSSAPRFSTNPSTGEPAARSSGTVPKRKRPASLSKIASTAASIGSRSCWSCGAAV